MEKELFVGRVLIHHAHFSTARPLATYNLGPEPIWLVVLYVVSVCWGYAEGKKGKGGEGGGILFIGKPQARDLTAQIAEPVAYLDLLPGVSVEELDLLTVRGSGDEMVLHVEAGIVTGVVPVTICPELDVWAARSVGEEGRSGAEVVGHKLKDGRWSGVEEEQNFARRGGREWRVYLVL